MSECYERPRRIMLTHVVRELCRDKPWLNNIGWYEPAIVSAVCDHYDTRQLPAPNHSCIVRTAYAVRSNYGTSRTVRRTCNH